MIINYRVIVFRVSGTMPVRNKHSKKNRKQYSRLDTKPRTKKVQTGGGFFWTSNEEEVARYLAHDGVKTIMTDTYSTDKDKQKVYNLAKQTLHDYLAAMIYRMYKLHRNAVINEYEKKIEEKKRLDPTYLAKQKPKDIKNIKDIKLKDVFAIHVKHNGKFDYGRKLYEKTNTSKQPLDAKDIIKFVKIADFLKFLNNDTNYVTSLEKIQNEQCQHDNRYQSTQYDTERYIKPILYKTDNKETTNALFGVCNVNILTSINIQNILYSYVVSVKHVIAGINNKDYRKTDVYKKAMATFEEKTRLLKNRVNIEQMASALFYYSMYVANNPSQQHTGYGGIYSGGYGGGYGEIYGGYGGYGRW